jgi:hypothetical protein
VAGVSGSVLTACRLVGRCQVAWSIRRCQPVRLVGRCSLVNAVRHHREAAGPNTVSGPVCGVAWWMLWRAAVCYRHKRCNKHGSNAHDPRIQRTRSDSGVCGTSRPTHLHRQSGLHGVKLLHGQPNSDAPTGDWVVHVNSRRLLHRVARKHGRWPRHACGTTKISRVVGVRVCVLSHSCAVYRKRDDNMPAFKHTKKVHEHDYYACHGM